ncbi:MAG: dienelactone hydrolase family protein [Bryobacterales bacterium]|nr:dienelactone hydrolase family protein [Bryobacterales bacterium]
MIRITVFALLIPLAATAQEPHAAVARQTFAELLRTSVEAPSVSVASHGRVTEEGLVVEDLSWVSSDDETVPAYLIRPATSSGQLPAVICLHGSSGSRKSMATEEFGSGQWTRPGRDSPHTRMLGWARELARRGFIALAITQRGLDRREPPINVQANAMLVQGRTAMGEILYEIRQGLTFLKRRDDVGKIGITGMSFGGITSFYTWLLDSRITAAAPICGGVGSLESFIRLGRLSYHGTYWWVPGMLPRGDHADFASAMAPKPLMLWAPTSDVGMPQEGVDRFREQVEPAYSQAGAEGALRIHQPPGEHSFTREAFEAMASFFDEFLR